MYDGATAPIMICEIGCNHQGVFSTAKKMIEVAADFCGVDVIKFQKRCSRELLTEEEYDAPHPNQNQSYGKTYGEHREFLEFDLEQHVELKKFCEAKGVEYSTSVWDLTSAREIASINPRMIKVPSAMNTDHVMLDYLFGNYSGEIHVSLGMTLRDEETAITNLAARHGRMKDLVLYHCVSGYPVENDQLYLLELTRLVDSYGGKVKDIGFSGHHKGIAPDIAALSLGAKYFERHFSLDRTLKGTDHAASLEPDGLRRLTRDLKSVHTALKRKDREILDVEEVQRTKLKKFVDLSSSRGIS